MSPIMYCVRKNL